MYRVIALLFAASLLIGCGAKPQDRTGFGKKWRAAATKERREMADVVVMHKLFSGATKAQVTEALGKADKAGKDEFGDDFIRYDLGTVATRVQHSVTFVFEKGVVVRILGNTGSISP